MPLEWVFFDVGAPILNETTLQERWRETFLLAAGEEGYACDDARYGELTKEGIAVYASSVTSFVAWRLAGGDGEAHRRLMMRFWRHMGEIPDEEYRTLNPLRDGVRDVIESLRREYQLGIVANQPARVEGLLREYGVWDAFRFQAISEVVGLAKPDIRLFQHALEKAGAPPSRCVMFGDRIDNDIVPSRALGIWTVLYKTGRHAAQEPRGPQETPHCIVTDVRDLPDAIRDLEEMSRDRD